MDEEYYGDFLFPGISVPTVEDVGIDDEWLLADVVQEDDDDDDFIENPYATPYDDDDGFIAPTPEELSCCHEEWEDWV